MSKNNNKPTLLYDFLVDYKKKYGYMPSIREMCDVMNLSSTSTIFYYLTELEKQGKIKRNNLKSRAIEIVQPEETFSQNKIPVIGTVAAGYPILAEENIEDYISVPDHLTKNNNTSNLFVLKVKGDSMIDAGIFEGDELIVRKQHTAENGQIVVALIEDSATVKRFYKDHDSIRLMPENKLYEPIIVKNPTILGIVIGLLRKF